MIEILLDYRGRPAGKDHLPAIAIYLRLKAATSKKTYGECLNC